MCVFTLPWCVGRQGGTCVEEGDVSITHYSYDMTIVNNQLTLTWRQFNPFQRLHVKLDTYLHDTYIAKYDEVLVKLRRAVAFPSTTI